MLQGHGGILKGCVQIGLGQMPCIASLCEKTEVRELKSPHHGRFLCNNSCISLSLIGSVDKHKDQKNDVDDDINQK